MSENASTGISKLLRSICMSCSIYTGGIGKWCVIMRYPLRWIWEMFSLRSRWVEVGYDCTLCVIYCFVQGHIILTRWMRLLCKNSHIGCAVPAGVMHTCKWAHIAFCHFKH